MKSIETDQKSLMSSSEMKNNMLGNMMKRMKTNIQSEIIKKYDKEKAELQKKFKEAKNEEEKLKWYDKILDHDSKMKHMFKGDVKSLQNNAQNKVMDFLKQGLSKKLSIKDDSEVKKDEDPKKDLLGLSAADKRKMFMKHTQSVCLPTS